MAAKRFSFFESYGEALAELSPEECQKAIVALSNYAFKGIEPEDLPYGAKVFFMMAKPLLDKRQTAIENGENGGRPKEETNEEETRTKHEASVSEKKPNLKDRLSLSKEYGLRSMDSGEGDGVRIVDEEKEMDEDTGDRVPSGASADETAALDHRNSLPDPAVKIKRAEGETVISHWNSLPEPIPKIKSIGKSGDRPRLLKARLSEYSLAGVVDAIERIKQSDFLQGKEGRNGWTVSFDWFIKPQNFRKVAEGNYDNGVRAPDSRHKTQLDEWREAL